MRRANAWLLHELCPWSTVSRPSPTLELVELAGVAFCEDTHAGFISVKSCVCICVRLVPESVKLTTFFLSIGRRDQTWKSHGQISKGKR